MFGEVRVKVEVPVTPVAGLKEVGLKTPVQPAGIVEVKLKVELLQPVSLFLTEKL